MKKVIFSGVQPSGNLHLGNYIGAIKQWTELQNQESGMKNQELIFCIVDLHAITVPQDPKVLQEKVLETSALFIACGIDPKKSHLFIQSENPDHTYLAWIFDCITSFGSLFRMTQFKEKSEKQRESTSVGLFNYPALMAADILLYGTDEVPVGDDQKQHIELTRDVAERFNKRFGNIFKLPRPLIQKDTARIMSLQNPQAKMSKSDTDPLGIVNLLDTKDVVAEKVKKAVTDSGNEIVKKAEKPAISNLLTIFESVSGNSMEELEKVYKGKSYSEFKQDLADAVTTFLEPIQKKYHEIRSDQAFLKKVLDEGKDYATSMSAKKIRQVNKAVGLGRK